MKKILFLSILSVLIMQGCKTAPATSAAAKPATPAAATAAATTAPVAEVKKAAAPVELDALTIMNDPNQGNCTSCHAIPARTDVIAGDIAPPFIDMKHRFPDFEKLRAAIYDQRALNHQTMMPPFGRNKVLKPEQIDSIARFIYQF